MTHIYSNTTHKFHREEERADKRIEPDDQCALRAGRSYTVIPQPSHPECPLHSSPPPVPSPHQSERKENRQKRKTKITITLLLQANQRRRSAMTKPESPQKTIEKNQKRKTIRRNRDPEPEDEIQGLLPPERATRKPPSSALVVALPGLDEGGEEICEREWRLETGSR